jgi:hypothetical protein
VYSLTLTAKLRRVFSTALKPFSDEVPTVWIAFTVVFTPFTTELKRPSPRLAPRVAIPPIAPLVASSPALRAFATIGPILGIFENSG